MPAADEIGPEVEAARLLLRRLLVATGWRPQDLDARLGFARGSTSRLLAGDMPLLYGDILRILRAIEVEPGFFFDTLHATRPAAGGVGSADFRREVRRWGFDGAVEEDVPLRRPGQAPDDADLEQRIIQKIKLALSHAKRERDREI